MCEQKQHYYGGTVYSYYKCESLSVQTFDDRITERFYPKICETFKTGYLTIGSSFTQQLGRFYCLLICINYY